MDTLKTKAVGRIEETMQGVEEGSLRYQILKSAKEFKTSWVELGRALYTAWKDKMFKSWGYMTFDAYTAKEIGIRKATALKLLKSYYFLEKEHAAYLNEDYLDSSEAASVPPVESIDLLRKAKEGKRIDQDDYATLKASVFEKGKDPGDVKRELTRMMKQREELDPDEVFQKKQQATVKRLLGALASLHREAEISKLLPAALLRELAGLVKKIEAELAPAKGEDGGR
ncbi:MAG: hypothetical protein WCP22_05000 [Chlamydiota bacterium]